MARTKNQVTMGKRKAPKENEEEEQQKEEMSEAASRDEARVLKKQKKDELTKTLGERLTSTSAHVESLPASGRRSAYTRGRLDTETSATSISRDQTWRSSRSSTVIRSRTVASPTV